MAPMHDGWRNDAEFLRYNAPKPPQWPQQHLWLAIVGLIGAGTILTHVLLDQLAQAGLIR